MSEDLVRCTNGILIQQVGERIWLVTFMQYDLGYFDDETCRLEPIDNPFGPKVSYVLDPSAHDGVMSDADRTLLDEGINLIDRSIAGVRTLSYLLHPPFLDEIGLLAAVRWYAKGFADRSGIAVDLEVPPTFERLPQDVESTLFRVVQEALTNIHRHARSATARIRLRAERDCLALEITDRGRGMSADVLSSVASGSGAPGVGLAGMRERLQQLGGALHIESTDRGTTLRATVPLQEHLS